MRVVILALAALLLGAAAPAPAAKPAPGVKAVNFTAQWCPNCRILDPRFAEAIKTLADPAIEVVTLDITNEKTWDASTQRAIDRDVIDVHNAYIGTTGLVVLAAADTGERIACLTAAMTAPMMEIAIRRAKERVAATARGQRFTGDLLCPKPRPQP